MAGPPVKNLFSGAGKAPERIVFYREGGPFKPQSRAALSWDYELRCNLKITCGGAGSRVVPLITAAERGFSTGSSAADAAVVVDVRLSLPFHETPPEGRFFVLMGALADRAHLENRWGGRDMASKRSARVTRAISAYSRSCSAGSRSSKPGEDTSAEILSRNRDQRFTLTYERGGCFVPDILDKGSFAASAKVGVDVRPVVAVS